MTIAALKGLVTAALTIIFASAIFGLVMFGLNRVWPRHDPIPAQVARADEKTATHSASAVAAQVGRQNDAASIHIDLTTKEIRDAFDAMPPPAPPAPDREPRALPPAPVDRVRDRLNEGIARANRAAGLADPAD